MIEGFRTNTYKDKFVISLVNSVNGIIHPNTKTNISQYELGEWPTFNFEKWTDKPVAVVGTLRGSEKVIWEAQKRKHTFLYMDHAYFHATRDYKDKGFGLLYRIIRSQMQLNYLVDLQQKDYKRIQRFKPIKVKTFHKSGRYILVLPPTQAIARLYGINYEEWLKETMNTIKKYTDRPIIIRNKTEKIPLQNQLKEAWAVVTYQSTAAIEAIINGVPVFCDEICCAKPVAETDFTKIEKPKYTDNDFRKKWIDSLLSCQFSMSEIESGLAYETTMRLQNDNYT